MSQMYYGAMNGVPYCADKPVILFGHHDYPVGKFLTRQEAWAYLAHLKQRGQAISYGRLYELQNGRWKPLPLNPQEV